MELVGRGADLDQIEAFLDTDPPRAFELKGEAGIGKTTIWREGVRLASERGIRVLMCRPARRETPLSFSGLSDLVTPALPQVLDALPPPQSRALEIALLLRDPDDHPVEERVVSVALAGALHALASQGRVLVALDDVQWLDQPSASALAFAVRRLREEERVSLLVTRRLEAGDIDPLELEQAMPTERLSRLTVGPLSLGALSRLLPAHVARPVSRPMLLRINEASGGNPLYAIEVARALERRSEEICPGERLPIPETLLGLVRERLVALPSETLAALEAAASLAEPSALLLAEANDRRECPALDPAVAAGVVEMVGDRVRFTHPLFGAALVDGMTPSQRRRLHRRLAAIVPSLEQRARHLAIATERPDEDVAAVLEQAATDVGKRGTSRFAAELLEDSVRLTPLDSPQVRRSRLLAASHAWRSSLDWERAQRLASEAVQLSREPSERAEALVALAECLQDPIQLAELVFAEVGDDPSLEARLCTLIADRHINVDSLVAFEHAQRAVDAAERAGDGTLLAQALSALGMIETVRCEGTPREHLERGIQVERAVSTVPVQYSPELSLAVHLMLRDELDEARDRFELLLARTRDERDELSQAHMLRQLARLELRAGRWEPAARYAEESADLYGGSADLLETAAALFVQATLTACRGDDDATLSLCRRARSLTGDTPVTVRQEAGVVGILELGRERYEDAATVLAQAYGDHIEPGLRTAAPDHIEALVGAGRLDVAEDLLRSWEDLGRRLDRPRVLATGARCRGLLLAAQGARGTALQALEEAIAEHDRLPVPFERARTLLVLGSLRRRLRRQADARKSLEQALAIFDELGAVPWAERARKELARVPGKRPRTGDDLTPAEQRIADLVAEGRSNKDVAAALFVSVKTVELTLTHVYRKLGVRSRSELTRLLALAPKD